MATKTVAVPFPNPLETSPLVKNLRRLWAFVRVWLVRTANTPERTLAVEDRVAVGPKKSLLVVRCYGQRFMVGVTADSIGPFVEVGTSQSTALSIAKPAAQRRARRERAS